MNSSGKSGFSELIARGDFQLKSGDFLGARESFLAAVDLAPENPGAWVGLAIAEGHQGSLETAISRCKRALEIDPTFLRAYGILGGLYQRLGFFEEAIACARKGIDLRPDLSKPYVEIVRCKKITGDDFDVLRALESMGASRERPKAEKFHIYWALGKAHDDLGDFKKAIESFDLANEIARTLCGPNRYDERARKRETNAIKETFSRMALQEVASSSPSSPVLVIGMIRSGTTLLDRLLCARTGLTSAGELRFWESRASGLGSKFLAGRFDPETVTQVESDYLTALGGTTFQRIDKMPTNFRHLGLIHLLFPNAKIVHIKRNPVDTCLSIYMTDFGPRPPQFAFDKRAIVHAYQMYQDLMNHWREVLPDGAYKEVAYEDLVRDPEGQLGGLTSYVQGETGHHSHEKAAGSEDIVTPSRWQARQPIYQTSVGREQNYEPWLGEFGKLR